MNQTQGRKMLKVTSVILLIFGALGTFSSISTLIGGNKVASASYINGEFSSSVSQLGGSEITITTIIGLVGAVLTLIAGIVGLLQSSKTDKATICVILGFAIIAVSIVSTIVSIMNINVVAENLSASFNNIQADPETLKTVVTAMAYTLPIVGFIINLILPLLYIRGASKKVA